MTRSDHISTPERTDGKPSDDTGRMPPIDIQRVDHELLAFEVAGADPRFGRIERRLRAECVDHRLQVLWVASG